MTTRHPTANASQRARRARIARIDYYPSPDALALIKSRRTRYGPTHNNSGIIDTIIAEWADLAGLKQSEIDKLKSPATSPELLDTYTRARISTDARNSTHAHRSPENLAKCAHASPGAKRAPEFSDASMRANNSGNIDLCHHIRAHAGKNNSGSLPAGNNTRVVCGAKRRRDGEPCQGLSVPGKFRCKWHGGASTGPRTDEGRARSIANLRQYRRSET